MKPHIFKDNGWKVGIDDRAIPARNIRHALEIAYDHHVKTWSTRPRGASK